MKQCIEKSVIVEEINRLIKSPILYKSENVETRINVLEYLLSFIDTLEVKDPYEQCVQYDSIKAGIQAHAETYSFNIESELFPQLTKEQQKLWRKEIEQAVISGGEDGVELARDQRYKENLKVKEADLLKEIANQYESNYEEYLTYEEFADIAKHFFELGFTSSLS